MADTDPGFDLEPNAGLDFSALLRAKGVPKDAPIGEAPADEDIDDNLEPEADEVEEQEEEVDVDVDDDEEEEETEQEERADPVDNVLTKFGIDPEDATDEQRKLAQGYAEMESLKGRQGNELGELRQQVSELQARMEQPAPSPTPEITQQTVEVLDAAAGEGGQTAMNAALWALKNDPTPDGALYNRVMEQWHEVQPRAALRFEMALQEYNSQLEQGKAIAPVVEEQHARQEENLFAKAWGAVAVARTDMQDVAPGIQTLIEQSPALAQRLANAIDSGDETQVALEIENLYLRARELATSAGGDTREAKKRATVVSGKRSAGRGKAKSEGDKLKERMLSTPRASVIAGLTFE